MDYLLPPLYNCLQGHSTACGMCSSLLGSKAECPTCKSPITAIRNFALEGIVRTAPLPCKFEENGCTRCPKGEEFAAHALSCRFRELVNCPLTTSGAGRPSGGYCKWRGAIPSVAGHLKDRHELLIATGKGDNGTLIIESILNFPKVAVATALIESDDHNMGFLIHIRKKDPEVKFAVQGLGTASEMANFNFALGLLSENPRCSLRWDSYPLAISEGLDWKTSQSVWPVSLDMAKTFHANGCLHLFWKIQPVIVS